MKQEILISWVVPCFNEEEVLIEAVDRINHVCNSMNEYRCEIILIDDGSKDKTREIIKRLITLCRLKGLLEKGQPITTHYFFHIFL